MNYRIVFVATVFCLFGISLYGQTPEEHLEGGIKRFKGNDYLGALAEFNNAIKKNPNYAKAYNNRGIIRSIYGNDSAALEDFNKTIELDSTAHSAYTNRGMIYLKQNKNLDAVSDFLKALNLKPDDAVAQKKLEIAYFLLQSSNEKGGNIIRKHPAPTPIPASSPKKDTSYRKSSNDIEKPTNTPVGVTKQEGSKVTKETLDTSSKTEPSIITKQSSGSAFKEDIAIVKTYPTREINTPVSNEFVAKGNLKTTASDYKAAFEAYTKAIESDSLNPTAYYYRGVLKTYFRNYQVNPIASTATHETYEDEYIKQELLKADYGAIGDYSKAIQLNPQYAEAFYKRGLSFYYLKQYRNAIMDFNKAATLTPTSADVYYYRGLAKGLLNDISGACVDFIKANALGNKDAKDFINDCH